MLVQLKINKPNDKLNSKK